MIKNIFLVKKNLHKEFLNKHKFEKIQKKNFNGIFERPTQSIITHIHILGIIVK